MLIFALQSNVSMKNILVTGGAGYIGSHTVIQLIEKGYNPIILDNFINSDAAVLPRIERLSGVKPTVYNVDLNDAALLEQALSNEKIDAIIHFAAFKAVGESVEFPLKYYKNNVQSLVNILEWAQTNEVKHFIFSSSCTVYGEPTDGSTVNEQSFAEKANSPYGTTKVIGEQLLRELKKSDSSFNCLSLRYFNPIGAHPSGMIGEWPIGRPNNLVPYITQTAIGVQKELTVYGNDYPTLDGTCVRDYVHVVDLANAHVLGLEYLNKQVHQEVEFINIGTGKGTSVLEIIAAFERIANTKLNWKFGPKRMGDVPAIYAEVHKAHSDLGWQAAFTFEDAIADAWRWEQNIRQ